MRPNVRRSGGGGLAALDLAAGAGGQKDKGRVVACLGRLPGAGVGAFGAVVLRHRVDAVALLELVRHGARHVVLHHLRRLLHALRRSRTRLDGECQSEGGRKGRCSEYVTIHWLILCWSGPEIGTVTGNSS